MALSPGLALYALPGLPIIQPGDDLAGLIAQALAAAELPLRAGDVLVITSKIVSKAEGRFVRLASVQPGDEARGLAARIGKDPRIVELILRESSAVSRTAPNTLITRHRLGFVAANAGIDQSNLGQNDDVVLLLPEDPDGSARRLRAQLEALTGVAPAIILSDSHGRPFRLGTVGVAIGVAGLPALRDLRGQTDMFGRVLRVTVQALADEIASAANLVSGEAAEGLPVVLVRGLQFTPADSRATDLVRPLELDLYRD